MTLQQENDAGSLENSHLDTFQETTHDGDECDDQLYDDGHTPDDSVNTSSDSAVVRSSCDSHESLLPDAAAVRGIACCMLWWTVPLCWSTRKVHLVL